MIFVKIYQWVKMHGGINHSMSHLFSIYRKFGIAEVLHRVCLYLNFAKTAERCSQYKIEFDITNLTSKLNSDGAEFAIDDLYIYIVNKIKV